MVLELFVVDSCLLRSELLVTRSHKKIDLYQ